VTPPHHEQTTPDAVLAPNLLPSIEDESEESENDAEEDGKTTASTAVAFFNRWSPAISGCSSREEIDLVAENCAAEWHQLTLKADKAAPK
jgi:hypothetical protein